MKKATKIQSNFLDFNIPFVIPKRSRGSVECQCKCTFKAVVANGKYLNPLDFISFLSPHANAVCDSSTLQAISKDIVKSAQLTALSIKVELLYFIDRVSPTFKPVNYGLPSYFESIFVNYKWFSNIGIQLPVRVKDVSVTAGELDYKLINHNSQHFEDLLEHVQYTTGFKLYPMACQDDENAIQGVIDKGKQPYEYLVDMQKRVTDKKYAKGGAVSLTIPDLYNMYKFNYKVNW